MNSRPHVDVTKPKKPPEGYQKATACGCVPLHWRATQPVSLRRPCILFAQTGRDRIRPLLSINTRTTKHIKIDDNTKTTKMNKNNS